MDAAIVIYEPNGDKLFVSEWELISVLASRNSFAYRRVEKNGKLINFQYSPVFQDFKKLIEWLDAGPPIPVERPGPKNSVHVHLP